MDINEFWVRVQLGSSRLSQYPRSHHEQMERKCQSSADVVSIDVDFDVDFEFNEV